MTAMRIESEDDIRRGVTALAGLDPRLAPVIAVAGDVPLRRRQPGYEGLAAIVVAQMVSKASADALWARMTGRVETVSPENLLALCDDDFRAMGLSRAKQASLLGVAKACAAGALDLDHLCSLDPDEAIAKLTAYKGIGPWTAQVYLLFCAGHRDIFPSGDIALQNAAAHALALDARPPPKTLDALAAAWSPWRSVAARLLWAYYGRAMGREVLPVDSRQD